MARHLAAIVSRVLTTRQRETLRPVRSASSALSQLILCSPANLATVSERALDVGLQVHGWHCAVRIAVDTPAGDEDVPALLEEEFVALIAGRRRDHRSAWTISQPDATLVLVRTTRTDPGRSSDDDVRRVVDELLGKLTTRHPDVRCRVGIATPHAGATGLRTSTEEARVALASAGLSGEPVSIATFDGWVCGACSLSGS